MQIEALDDLEHIVCRIPTSIRLAVAGADDVPTLEAAFLAGRRGIVHPILIGDEQIVKNRLRQLDMSIDGFAFLDRPEPEAVLDAALHMAVTGQIDILIKGRLPSELLTQCLSNPECPLKTAEIMSHMSLLQIPTYHKLIALTDSGLNEAPTFEEKRAIIKNATDALHLLGMNQPKVAMLAASETVNPKLQESIDGQRMKQLNLAGEITGCIIEGPLSYEAAMVPGVTDLYDMDCRITGDSDLLLVPNLTAGTLLGKCLTCSGGTRSASVILGAKLPVILTSLSAPSQDKYDSILLSALLAFTHKCRRTPPLSHVPAPRLHRRFSNETYEKEQ